MEIDQQSSGSKTSVMEASTTANKLPEVQCLPQDSADQNKDSIGLECHIKNDHIGEGEENYKSSSLAVTDENHQMKEAAQDLEGGGESQSKTSCKSDDGEKTEGLPNECTKSSFSYVEKASDIEDRGQKGTKIGQNVIDQKTDVDNEDRLKKSVNHEDDLLKLCPSCATEKQHDCGLADNEKVKATASEAESALQRDQLVMPEEAQKSDADDIKKEAEESNKEQSSSDVEIVDVPSSNENLKEAEESNKEHGSSDVEIVDEASRNENLRDSMVVDISDDESSDEELMGFHFNDDGELVDKQNERFEFRRYKNNSANQKRYRKLGTKITEYIYSLLETRCKLKRVFIPVDAAEDEARSFIFVSDGAFETEDKLIIFIHGNGVVRAGQWAQSLIINYNLDCGSQIPFIEEALKRGYEVMVLNTNLNTFSESSWPSHNEMIRGSEDAERHAVYVWENLVEEKVKAKHIAIVAHSYGGVVTKELVSLKSEQFFEKVFAVAFTDSVHDMRLAFDPEAVIKFFHERARNWVTSSLPVDEPIESKKLKSMNDAPKFSSGHIDHKWTSWSSFTAIFKFLDEEYCQFVNDSKQPSSNL